MSNQSMDRAADREAVADRGESAPSLPDLAKRALARDPARRAIEFEGVWHDWGAVRQLADSVTDLINAAGVAPDAAIGLVARSRPEMVAALIGLVAAGRTIQMIYAFQSPTVIARDIRALKPGVVIVVAQDMTDALDCVLAEQGIAGIVLDAMAAHAAPGHAQSRIKDVAVHDMPQIEVLTSGTTGPPKRFPISFDMMARHYMGNRMMGARHDDVEAGPPFLLFYPLGNISGIYSTLPTMLRGQPVMLLDRFSLEAWHDFVLRYRPTASGIPPSAFRMLLDADIPREDLASLKAMASGAAPLDPSVQRAFEARYGIPVLMSYGATEFGGPVAAMTLELVEQFDGAKLGSVGRPLPGARLQVVDPVTDALLPAGCEGLLEVSTPRIGQEWIRTSDIAVIDADGFLFIRGRADGAIMRGGFKLLPETIERALLEHPAIGAAAVVGVADTRLGQVPGAAIQRKAGAAPLSAAEAEAHLRNHVPATHIPVHWRMVDDLPKNPSMKIDRPAVAKLFTGD
ncbi:long-chain fatty acid--CoA ligase [Sphingobium aromaticiconvertens]|uniref:class I adenylate-forming enzyme family protein n=1 Tax=Sphingobium aromaticiconvertens TaxID=365341 RepID=UPI003018AA96